MRRRDFISVLGGVAATWPLAAHAQQPARMARLGYLAPASISHLIEALRGGLRDLGYVEGQNLAIEYRFALGQSKTYDELAAELVSLSPDAIVVVGTPPALAAKRQTTSIPVIMAPTADPLRLGLAASLARPGGNVTGVSLSGSELARKRMEVFREAVAGIQRKGGFDALTVLSDAQFNSARRQISGLAATHRLPTMYEAREFVEDGGLISYGPNITDLSLRAAAFVVKVLNGAKPADLPIEQPTRFQLVINLKTAKALNLDVPPSLLARADEVIE